MTYPNVMRAVAILCELGLYATAAILTVLWLA